MLVIPCIILGIWQKDGTNRETKSEVVSLMSKNTEPVNECILIQKQDSTIKLLGHDAEEFKRDVQNSVLKKTLVNRDMPYAIKIIMDDELNNVIYANYDKTNNAIYYDSKNDCAEHIKTLTLSIDESVACGADVALVPEENIYYKYIMVNEEREEQENGIMYKSERMGISFIIPNNWIGKYRIDEVEDGLWVHFTLMDSVNEGDGFLFAILKAASVIDVDTFDGVGVPRTFQAGDVTYITGGPTGITVSEGAKEFNTYCNMQSEIKDIIRSIRVER